MCQRRGINVLSISSRTFGFFALDMENFFYYELFSLLQTQKVFPKFIWKKSFQPHPNDCNFFFQHQALKCDSVFQKNVWTPDSASAVWAWGPSQILPYKLIFFFASIFSTDESVPKLIWKVLRSDQHGGGSKGKARNFSLESRYYIFKILSGTKI